MTEEHLKDYVWMRPPDGGDPEKVPCDNDLLVKRMVAGWAQVDPPVEKPAAHPVAEGLGSQDQPIKKAGGKLEL